MKILLFASVTVMALSPMANAGCGYRLNKAGRLDSVVCSERKARVVRVNADLDGRIDEILPSAATSLKFSVISFCLNTDANGKVLSEISCAL